MFLDYLVIIFTKYCKRTQKIKSHKKVTDGHFFLLLSFYNGDEKALPKSLTYGIREGFLCALFRSLFYRISDLGSEGRRFKSCRPDHYNQGFTRVYGYLCDFQF